MTQLAYADTVEAAPEPSFEDVLVEWGQEVIDLDGAIDRFRLRRDAVKAEIRARLEQRGVKSFRRDGVSIRLSPCHETWCTCHRAPVSLCPSALAGQPVTIERVECVPWLVVRSVE